MCVAALNCVAQKTTTVSRTPLVVDVSGPSLPLVSDPGECPEINWPLHMEGTSQAVVTQSTRDGVTYMLVHVVTKGTATDVAGNEFNFQYVNNFKTSFDTSSGEVFVNFTTDHFSMEGPAGSLSVGFVGSLILAPDGTFLGVVVDHGYGNWACDPI